MSINANKCLYFVVDNVIEIVLMIFFVASLILTIVSYHMDVFPFMAGLLTIQLAIGSVGIYHIRDWKKKLEGMTK